MGLTDGYEVIQKIGSGSFGAVCKIQRKSDGKILAWKEINYGRMNEKEKVQLVSEVNILRELRHPNIVRYYDRILDKDNSKIFIIMEFCEGGDLTSIIKRCRREKKYIDEEVVWKIFTQIVLALDECHHRKGGVVLHRDVKPDNILLDKENNVKLSDFGLSRVLGSKDTLAQTFLGTPYYMSPEQVSQTGYNEKSDIWSLACLVYEMCALVPPFDAQTHAALNAKIRVGKYPPLPPQYSEEMNKVIRWMLEVDQIKRPTTTDLLQIFSIKMCVRERKITQHYASLKKKEDELIQREAAILKKEKELELREAQLQLQLQMQSAPKPSFPQDHQTFGCEPAGGAVAWKQPSRPVQRIKQMPNIGGLTLSAGKENSFS